MSQPNTGASLPAGYSPPFAVVTEENHSAWIIIATALGLACVLVFVSARVVVRASMTSSMGKDDLLLASSLVSIGESVKTSRLPHHKLPDY